MLTTTKLSALLGMALAIGTGAAITVSHLNAQQPLLLQPTTISVNNPRPLARALASVQEIYRSVIDFEEVPYEHPADLDSTLFPGSSGASPHVVPHGGQLTVTLSPGADTTPYLAAESVLSAFISAGYGGEYVVQQGQGRIEVVPTRLRGANGSMRNVLPIMGIQISLPLANRPAAATFALLATKLSAASGIRVVLADEPFQDNAMIEYGAENKSARDIIAEIASRSGMPLSFMLLYDPYEKSHYLTIKNVAPTSPPVGATTSIPRVATPKTSPADSPFFVKSN